MNLNFPRPRAAVFDGGEKALGSDWRRWLNALWSDQGYDPKKPIYEDPPLYTPGLSMANPDSLSLETVQTSLRLVTFPAAGTSTLYFSVRLPNKYLEGTDLTPYVEWQPTTTGSGDVNWRISHSYSQTDAAMATIATETISSAAPEVDEQKTRVTFTDIDGSSFVRGASLVCSVSRMGDEGSDDYAAAAALFGAGFKHQVRGHGETEQFP